MASKKPTVRIDGPLAQAASLVWRGEIPWPTVVHTAARRESLSYRPFHPEANTVQVSRPAQIAEAARLDKVIRARVSAGDSKHGDETTVMDELGPAMGHLAWVSLRYRSAKSAASPQLERRGPGPDKFDRLARREMRTITKKVQALERALFAPEARPYTSLLQFPPGLVKEVGRMKQDGSRWPNVKSVGVFAAFDPWPEGFTLELLREGLASLRERAEIRVLEAVGPNPGKPNDQELEAWVRKILTRWSRTDTTGVERRIDLQKYLGLVMKAITGKTRISPSRRTAASLRR